MIKERIAGNGYSLELPAGWRVEEYAPESVMPEVPITHDLIVGTQIGEQFAQLDIMMREPTTKEIDTDFIETTITEVEEMYSEKVDGEFSYKVEAFDEELWDVDGQDGFAFSYQVRFGTKELFFKSGAFLGKDMMYFWVMGSDPEISKEAVTGFNSILQSWRWE
jgi:hypothetical protein